MSPSPPEPAAQGLRRVDADREMRCPDCGTRLFTSRAEEFVARHFACPRCRTAMELVPGRCGS
jgi:DNA-directed RNA polymerase subunit RPC12/RpoP